MPVIDYLPVEVSGLIMKIVPWGLQRLGIHGSIFDEVA